MDKEQFHRCLASAVKHGASDIHFRTGSPPSFRVRGQLLQGKTEPLTPKDTENIVTMVMKGHVIKGDISILREADASYVVPELSRFRVNIYRQRNDLALVMRLVPSTVPTIEQLRLPPVLKRIAEAQRGLILVTGVTGSGKTSTLAGMINHINEHKPHHIITIEDPIEFVHKDKVASISQREVGLDTVDFVTGLRAALRQDPDVILVGEMRDPESIEIALKATETGHVVFSTLHTSDAEKTVGRILGSFPAEVQKDVRMRLADGLHAIISQRLLPRADKQGRIVAAEIMVASGAIKDAIRNPKAGSIPDLIADGFDPYGMQTFDQHLLELCRAGRISRKVALAASTDPAGFKRDLVYDG